MSLGGNANASKSLKFDKTKVNDKELNTMVNQAVTASLKGCKKKRTRGIATYSDTSIEYDTLGINRINLSGDDYEWQTTGGPIKI